MNQGQIEAGATPRKSAKGLWAFALLLAALGAWGLLRLFSPAATNGPASAANGSPHGASAPLRSTKALSDEQLDRMAKQVLEQTQKEPQNATAWAMLAHTYEMQGKFAESVKAYAKLVALKPQDAQVLADYADTLAMNQGRQLAGEPEALIQRALALDGKNQKALSLAGASALERKDYAQAVQYWQKAQSLSSDPKFKDEIQLSIQEAQDLAKGGVPPKPLLAASGTGLPHTVVAAASQPAQAIKTGPQYAVAGKVSIDANLLKGLSPEATVFIFAKPENGSRMPVAILRKKVRDLPFDFVLDDTLAMVPESRISNFKTVTVVARVSQRGDVSPQPGDLQVTQTGVALGKAGLKLEVNEAIK